MPNFPDEKINNKEANEQNYREKIDEKEGLKEVPFIEAIKEKQDYSTMQRAPLKYDDEEKMKLKQELEKIELPEREKLKAEKVADTMREMQLEGKLNRLFDLAGSQGVPFAIETARKINDACLLDLFHDKLIERGLHKKIGSN